MKKLFSGIRTITAAIFLVWLIMPLNAQLKDTGQPAKTVADKSYVTGGNVVDSDIQVSNFSFSRRYAEDGRGEYLDVFFDVKNYTTDSQQLEFYVIGLWEKDAVDARKRDRIPYPAWRKRDYDKEKLDIIFADSVPVLDKSAIDPEAKGKTDYPAMMEYINWMEKNPGTGSPFTLLGIENTKEELKSGARFNITSKSLMSTVFARLYTRYSLRYYLFNHIGVIIRNVTTKKTVYRQFFNFKHNLKLY